PAPSLADPPDRTGAAKPSRCPAALPRPARPRPHRVVHERTGRGRKPAPTGGPASPGDALAHDLHARERHRVAGGRIQAPRSLLDDLHRSLERDGVPLGPEAHEVAMAAGTVEDDPKLDGHLERPAVPGVAEELEPRDPARSVDEGHPARGGGPHERRAQSGALDD